MTKQVLKFHIGQIIQHNKFGYRGVIFDADAEFSGSESWYEQVAKSRLPKNAPWYHVLVDDSDITTNVAERHIQETVDNSEIIHPLIDMYFSNYSQGQYTLQSRQ